MKLLRDQYFSVHQGSLEANTLFGMELHFKLLVSTFGAGYPIKQLDQAAMKIYATKRSAMKNRGRLTCSRLIRV